MDHNHKNDNHYQKIYYKIPVHIDHNVDNHIVHQIVYIPKENDHVLVVMFQVHNVHNSTQLCDKYNFK
uniref:Uncharacterized protein n=1 Tax=Meloidogyne incognita TaxID=6306 RepID=A0A914LXJ2_MELIC